MVIKRAEPSSGLRERKRAETRARLEEQALALALRDGLEVMTVEKICAEAGYSPRTFFNYFASKEDAVLGIHELEFDDTVLAEHSTRHESAEAAEWVMSLLFRVAGPAVLDSPAHRQRLAIIRDHPHLAARRIVQLAQIREAVVSAVTRRLSVDSRWDGFDPRDGSVETLINLCFGAMRQTVARAEAEEPYIDSDELKRRSLVLVREIAERIL